MGRRLGRGRATRSVIVALAFLFAGLFCLRHAVELRTAVEPAGLVVLEEDEAGVLSAAGAGRVEWRTLDAVGVPAAWLRGVGARWFHGGVGLCAAALALLGISALGGDGVPRASRGLAVPVLSLAAWALWRLCVEGGTRAGTAQLGREALWVYGPVTAAAVCWVGVLLARRPANAASPHET